jgi:hypothetical protein
MTKNLSSLALTALLVACAQTGTPPPPANVTASVFDENEALTKYEEAYADAMEKCMDLSGDARKACLKAARAEARKAVAVPKK